MNIYDFVKASCGYAHIVQKIVNKRINVNAKHENEKNVFCISHVKTTVMELFQYYAWYSIFSLFLF
jgi:hypothetical protein